MFAEHSGCRRSAAARSLVNVAVLPVSSSCSGAPHRFRRHEVGPWCRSRRTESAPCPPGSGVSTSLTFATIYCRYSDPFGYLDCSWLGDQTESSTDIDNGMTQRSASTPGEVRGSTTLSNLCVAEFSCAAQPRENVPFMDNDNYAW
jgi:hypothetical protein